MAKQIVKMKLNGQEIEQLVDTRTLLVHFLREQMNLTGAHIGCETSHCGVCTVDIDGESVKACTHLAVQCDGCEVKTVEGLADGEYFTLCKRRFMRNTAFSAVIARWYADDFVPIPSKQSDPTEDEIRIGLSGNLCRCTGYQNIVKAVKSAAVKLQQKESATA